MLELPSNKLLGDYKLFVATCMVGMMMSRNDARQINLSGLNLLLQHG